MNDKQYLMKELALICEVSFKLFPSYWIEASTLLWEEPKDDFWIKKAADYVYIIRELEHVAMMGWFRTPK